MNIPVRCIHLHYDGWLVYGHHYWVAFWGGFCLARIGLGFRTWAYTVYLSSLLLLFSYDFNFLLGVLAFGGSFGAVNRKGLALLEYARRIRVLAWDVLMCCTGCLSFARDCSIHPSICYYCIGVYCVFDWHGGHVVIPLHCCTCATHFRQ